MMKTRFSRSLPALMIASAMTLAAAATGPAAAESVPVSQSQAGDAGSAPAKMRHARAKHKSAVTGGHHRFRADSGMWIPGYGMVGQKAVDALALTDSQLQLLQEARDSTRENLRGHRKAARRTIDADKGLDPHGVVTQRARLRAERQQAQQAVTGKWLALWDALEPGQRDALAAHVAQRHEKRAEHRRKHRRQKDRSQG